MTLDPTDAAIGKMTFDAVHGVDEVSGAEVAGQDVVQPPVTDVDGTAGSGSEEPAVSPAPEVEAEQRFTIDGVEMTASEIKSLQAKAARAADLEAEATDIDRLSVWRQMDELATKYPSLRDDLVAVFQKYEATPENADEKIAARPELTEDEKVRAAYIDAKMREDAGKEIDTVVEAYSKKYPSLVRYDDKWMAETLLPAVLERFGDRAGLRQIKMTLNDLVVEGGGLGTAEQNGAAQLASRLAQAGPGARIVTGPTTRGQAEAPVKIERGKDIFDTIDKGFRSIGSGILNG